MMHMMYFRFGHIADIYLNSISAIKSGRFVLIAAAG